MNERIATVFGGTGFLGRRLVRAFADAGFHVRVAAREPRSVSHPEIAARLEPVEVDIRHPEAVSSALEGASAAVNAVSLYQEREGLTFEAIHAEGAATVARACESLGVDALVHVSGIGADRGSESALVRAKAQGEEAVRAQYADAVIFRPSVMFGRGDAFVSGLKAATRFPVVPLFGRGELRLQPAWVQDVARAAVHAAGDANARGDVYELGGARVLSYREAVEAVCAVLGRRRMLVPFPMTGWRALVRLMQVLPNPPLSIDQLHLLAAGNTASKERPGFAQLEIQPRSVLDMLEHCLQ